MNKLLLIGWFVLGSIGAYCNDSILVNREWTERQTIYVKEAEIDSIGEDSFIENNGIACGYDGCIKIEFLNNYIFRKIYPNGKVRHGRWILEDNILTIVYDKKERWEKKKCKFIIKYRNKKGYPTLYLFKIKGRIRACYIFCNYI